MERLKEYILAEGLRAGDRLPTETDLAEHLGVSRSAIREALRALEALGIISVRQGSGRYVNPFSFQPILDNLAYSLLYDLHTFEELLEVREKLEFGFLEEAIHHLTPEILQELHSIVGIMWDKMSPRGQDEEFLDEDMRFHITLYKPLDNALLLKLFDVFWQVQKRLRAQGPNNQEDWVRVIRQHEGIMEALENRDVALARARLQAHFEGVRAWLAREKAP